MEGYFNCKDYGAGGMEENDLVGKQGAGSELEVGPCSA